MSFRTPRKTKKQVKRGILVYDLNSIPRHIDISQIYNMYQNGLVIYDSKISNGERPYVIGRHSRIKFINKETL